ncbi:two-component system, NtrC family, response regulator HydG [Chitinophaga rupis]|uniref:Two-component system, NtrC family, response regulator HydG n=1 Tax=Chitinophaga rupis TaxID=573321 RepID=A0A1H7HE48_9BACT|nr:sigma-54 dependent transcriptional regulator [Chitinophaga rupis]SEK48676.1 two-component system, NtrC family, response regulator HydG [Chitinophaga rupis]
MKNILIIDDEPGICSLLRTILGKQGFMVDTTLSGNTALKMIKEKSYDIVFCDFRLKDKEQDGSTLLQVIHTANPETAVIIMTGYPDVRIAIRLIKEGAYDYLPKPFTATQITEVANRASAAQPLPVTALITPSPLNVSAPKKGPGLQLSDHYVYGESERARELLQQIKLVAPTNYSIVIYGETGTGKESVARLVHMNSARAQQPFVALDCGCLTDELAASELFGHEKGAFTGAINAVQGAFREAQGGTLFLDEISNLSYNVQIALLRVVQERAIRPVGSTREIPVDIRLIVASNEDPAKSVEKGNFRQDLFYRLNEFNIAVPPLRERLQDLPLLINGFVEEIQEELQKKCGAFSDDVIEHFYTYAWPGNIRELKNVIRRLCLLSVGLQEIPLSFLPQEMMTAPQEPLLAEDGAAVAQEDQHHLKTISRQAEYDKILSVMKQALYNKTKAAQLMNIDRKTLYNKLHLYKIKL